MEFNTIADLKGWQTQLAERTDALEKDKAAFNKLQVLIQDTVSNHVSSVIMPLDKPKQDGIPNNGRLRGMVHKILTAKTRVSLQEIIVKVHTMASIPLPVRTSDSKLTNNVYPLLKALKKGKLIKGTSKGYSLTATGRLTTKHWS